MESKKYNKLVKVTEEADSQKQENKLVVTRVCVCVCGGGQYRGERVGGTNYWV